MESIKLFLKLYYRPLEAMSGIIDSGNWLHGALAVALLSLLLNFVIAARLYKNYEAVPKTIKIPARLHNNNDGDDFDDSGGRARQIRIIVKKPLPLLGDWGWWFISFSPYSILSTVLSLAFLYVPAIILLIIFLEPLGSFRVTLQREYIPLASCTFMAWSAAQLPCLLLGLALLSFNNSDLAMLALWLAGKLYFIFLMIFAMRAVFNARLVRSIAAISVAGLSSLLQPLLLWFASPFLLIWVITILRGEFSDINLSYRNSQNFRRNLQAATVNPQDAEAHYQLGLIYQRRRQYTEAIARFNQAIEIDKREIDAHYQLGRIAREQGRLQEAINHFGDVVSLDDKHSQSEVWREIGATYEAAGMYQDAYEALSRYIERRSHDPEGLYYFAKTLNKLGRIEETCEILDRCIAAVESAPDFNRRQLGKWRKLAKEMKSGLTIPSN
jgi:tetratricopeptide (TPR) repeat protein